jgi:hypothetical protein
MAGFVRECHNCTPETCAEYDTCEDRKARASKLLGEVHFKEAKKPVDWHGKMTAKAAWRLGYITREEFVAIRKAWKLKKLMMEGSQ